jgi:hypothetical protein
MFKKNSMEFHGKVWNSIKFSTKFSMEIFMEFHGIQWNSMENSMN